MAFDYGDGGAFPEIHRAQYPLDLGRPDRKSNALAMTTTKDGDISNSALVRHGVREGKTVFSKHSDMVEKDYNDAELARPSEEAIGDSVAAARKALMAKIAAKTAGNRPGQTPGTDSSGATYFRYNASETAGNLSTVQNRMIKMVTAQKDPLEVPKFRAKRVPAGPPSPPAPLLHSPSRKLTKEDQQDWKVPPCISRWKNPKGYVIPLDKRLAAEGVPEGAEVHNVDAVASLTRGLDASARVQRKQIEERRTLTKQREIAKKQKQDEVGQELAKRAQEAHALAAEERQAMTTAEREDERKREEIRHEKQQAFRYARRKQENRMARTGGNIEDRDGERDLNERMALNLGVGGRGQASDFYDQRLFNQDTTKGNGDFNDPDGEGAAYSKDLLNTKQHTQFRATRETLDEEHRRQGASGLAAEKSLDFEIKQDQAEDVFGFDDILDDVKKGRGKKVCKHKNLKRTSGSEQRAKNYELPRDFVLQVNFFFLDHHKNMFSPLVNDKLSKKKTHFFQHSVAAVRLEVLNEREGGGDDVIVRHLKRKQQMRRRRNKIN